MSVPDWSGQEQQVQPTHTNCMTNMINYMYVHAISTWIYSTTQYAIWLIFVTRDSSSICEFLELELALPEPETLGEAVVLGASVPFKGTGHPRDEHHEEGHHHHCYSQQYPQLNHKESHHHHCYSQQYPYYEFHEEGHYHQCYSNSIHTRVQLFIELTMLHTDLKLAKHF